MSAMFDAHPSGLRTPADAFEKTARAIERTTDTGNDSELLKTVEADIFSPSAPSDAKDYESATDLLSARALQRRASNSTHIIRDQDGNLRTVHDYSDKRILRGPDGSYHLMPEDEDLDHHLAHEEVGGDGFGGGPADGGARRRVFRGRDGKMHLQNAKGLSGGHGHGHHGHGHHGHGNRGHGHKGEGHKEAKKVEVEEVRDEADV